MKKKLMASLFAAAALASVGFSTVHAISMEEADGWGSVEEINKDINEHADKLLNDWEDLAVANKPVSDTDLNGNYKKGSTEDYAPGLDKKLEELVDKNAEEILDNAAARAVASAKKEAPVQKTEDKKAVQPAAQKVLPKTSAVK